jgi:hypothetical protein
LLWLQPILVTTGIGQAAGTAARSMRLAADDDLCSIWQKLQHRQSKTLEVRVFTGRFMLNCIGGYKRVRRCAQRARGRRYVYLVLPVSVLLFAGGVGFCCVVTPAAFGFLIRFNVELGGGARFILSSYLRFFMRLLLVFGLALRTPLVLWFLV